jgi:hypothetical protein
VNVVRLLAADAQFATAQRRMLRAPRASLARLLATIVAGAALSAVAVYIGSRWLTMLWNVELGFLPVAAGRIDPMRATLLALVAGPLLLAAAFCAAAPLFGRPRQPLAALAVAVIGMTPIYLAGAAMFFAPAVLLMALAFMVTCYRWGQGARRLLGIADSEIAEFIAIALLAASVALQFASALVADWLTA